MSDHQSLSPIKKLKVTELKKVLETRGLPLHGRKDDLVERVAELIKKEGKTLDEIIAIDEKENEAAKKAAKKAAIAEATPVDDEPLQEPLADEIEGTTDAPDVPKERKWYTDYLERKDRISKFNSEPSELDLKIERMMRFGELTKDDPWSKIKNHGPPVRQQRPFYQRGGRYPQNNYRSSRGGRESSRPGYSPRPRDSDRYYSPKV